METSKIFIAVKLDGNFNLFVTRHFLFCISGLLNIFIYFRVNKYRRVYINFYSKIHYTLL